MRLSYKSCEKQREQENAAEKTRKCGAHAKLVLSLSFFLFFSDAASVNLSALSMTVLSSSSLSLSLLRCPSAPPLFEQSKERAVEGADISLPSSLSILFTRLFFS